MTRSALVFMIVSWTLVLGLTCAAFARILRQDRRSPSKPGNGEHLRPPARRQEGGAVPDASGEDPGQ